MCHRISRVSSVNTDPQLLGILFVSKDQFEVWAWLILSSFAKIRQRVAVKV